MNAPPAPCPNLPSSFAGDSSPAPSPIHRRPALLR
ncbi:uncharacterized protein G2W53_010924 [Senna tora]|uniref:Uncharacterized protein n=1 Tax=Senna tora TaxID=362788 RepID=A0A834X1T3_9FABA|nr:uncharacterized protein G2W53_010924 [Senna tora]